MKPRVRILDTKFKVDTVNKIVICELKCDLQTDKVDLKGYITRDMWGKQFPNIKWDGLFVVKAKARCINEDTFDERKGKMIAESKAKVKMYSIASRIWEEVASAIESDLFKCKDVRDACARAKLIEEDHVAELSR